MRGRKPKPVQRAFAEGDTRHIGANKLAARLESLPKGLRGLPDAPAHLNAQEREQWAIWKQDLELMGADYRADVALLEGACVMYARALRADATLRREGTEIEEPIQDRVTGEIIGQRLKNHPALSTSNASWEKVRSLCSELGLTLVARQRLSAADSGAQSPMDDLMKLLTTPRKHDDKPVQ
jgi:P27 family predicted phage terminase small subunit